MTTSTTIEKCNSAAPKANKKRVDWHRVLWAALLLLPAAASATDDDERVYQERLKAVMANGGILREYQPQEPLLGASQITPLPKAAGRELTLVADALAKAESYARNNNSSAFMVWHQGKLLRETYFGSVTASTPLVSKSLSKPLSAIAVGRALQLGKLKSLDQPVADFIKEWQGTDKSRVLVRHLLDMRAGFLQQGYSKDPDSPWNRAYLTPNLEAYLVNHYPLVKPPGSEYLYSNATGDMVSVLIERATGMRYGDFIGREVLQKIGAPGGSLWVAKSGGTAHSGCCKFLPAETWLRLAILLMGDGVYDGEQVLPKGFAKAMATATEQNPYYGMGVWVAGDYIERRGFTGALKLGPQVLHSQAYPDKDLYLFDGNSNQVVYILPNYELIILRLGKSPPKEPEWDNSVLPNLIVNGLNINKRHPASEK